MFHTFALKTSNQKFIFRIDIHSHSEAVTVETIKC